MSLTGVAYSRHTSVNALDVSRDASRTGIRQMGVEVEESKENLASQQEV